MAGEVLEHRIADRRVLRLIEKWLAAGVIEEGTWTAFEQGVPQGASVSPLLANVYLHYVFDLWAHQWRSDGTRAVIWSSCVSLMTSWWGSSIGRTRSGSGLICANRLAEFSLELNAEKTRLIEFGRFAAERSSGAGSWPA